MPKLKSYAESVLFQSIVALSTRSTTPAELACLSEEYISRLGVKDVPIEQKRLLQDIQVLLNTLCESNGKVIFSDEAWTGKKKFLLTLIAELYSDVVAWNAVEQYISASSFISLAEERGVFQGSEQYINNQH
ncbi:hypothetical protein M8013_12055 [Enterobacteriaceae bacterium H4N4]|uniref:Uncharacterized protein n=1 Tax=Silvania confinis TaxID=2926470 RepID=A0A9J6QJE8_9ENTR|nr:hypothetical protein [Silvania confinis]MCU6669478.1 hypothetical protein [Silvania confinis]